MGAQRIRLDLTGLVFGRLTVVLFACTVHVGVHYKACWNCVCSCGTLSVVQTCLRFSKE